MEIWKEIEGYEGLYEVSNLGRIKSLQKDIILKNRLSKRGYYLVSLYKNGKSTTKWVHRLVAKAFISNPDNLPQINHKDENSLNNCADNLEWCTTKYSNNYGSHNSKLRKALKGKAGRHGKTVHCVDLDTIYKSITEAEKQTGIAHIGEVCSGHRQTAGGMLWEWI